MTGMIPGKRGLLTAREKDIKTFKIGNLGPPKAMWLPLKVAILNCRGHQKDYSPEARGN